MSAPLFDLLQAYSALKHPRLLSFPSQLAFHQVHRFVLSSILLNPHLSQFPPSHTYQLSFWKWVIEHLELLLGDEACAINSFTFTNTNLSFSLTQEDAEIDQRLYDRLISLVATSKPVYVHQVLRVAERFPRFIMIGLTTPLCHPHHLSSPIIGERLLCQPILSHRWNAILSLCSSPELLLKVVPLDCGRGVPVLS